MKTVKDKYLVVGADFAGYPLKEAVVAHLKAKGWKITDLGVTAESDPDDTENMFHRVGLRVGSKISEGEFERALIFCGTGMGIHIAASKCPQSGEQHHFKRVEYDIGVDFLYFDQTLYCF